MSSITLNPEQKQAMLDKMQKYFADELDFELAQFDADFLLDFIAKEFGKIFYNQGLFDAQKVLSERVEHITDDILQLEKY